MSFKTAEDVLKCIRCGDEVEAARSRNRTRVLKAANFTPPFSESDAEKMGIKTNVNFGELAITLSHARMQLLSAFLSNQYFFTVKIPQAPVEKRAEWEAAITEAINKPMRKSPAYFELVRNIWNSVTLHGTAARTWRHSENWLPQFVALDDLRIPTDTTLDFKNLTWYAQRVPYTPIELVTEVYSKKKDNGWNKKSISQILENYKELNVTDAQNNYSWPNDAEKIADLMKQSGGFYGSDAVPVIPLWHFYFQDEDPKDPKKQKWFMRVVADPTAVRGSNGASDDFLWKSKEPIADNWRHLLHCQYGDLSADSPYKFHAVRGLGFALIEPTFFSNLLKCRFLDGANDTLNAWFQILDAPEKARTAIQEFGNFKAVSKNIRMIPAAERHKPDQAFVESAQAQMKQLQQEASTSYTQATDTGTAKEQTAFETRVKLEQVNALMSGIFLVATKYESYAYEEICRRFCNASSTDEDVQKFHKQMKRAGIHPDFLDVDIWDVEPVTPLGQGNPTLALATAQQLMSIKDQLSPEAQQQVLHDFILITTKSPSKAAQLAPLEKKDPSDATQLAADRFGALMQGVPLPLRNKNLIDQIDIIMGLMAGKITMITQRDNMATVEEGQGLANTSQYITQAIQQLAQDQQQKPRVKQYTDSMGKLDNEIKGLIQRGAQKREADAKKAQDGENAAEMAKAQATIQLAQAKIQLGEQQAQAKLHQTQIKDAHALTQKQIADEADQHRKSQAAQADEQRKDEAAKAELERQNEAAKRDIARENAKTAADIANSRKIATAKANEPKPKATAADK